MNLHEAFSKACEDRSHYTGAVPNLIVDWQEIGHSTFLLMNVRADEKFWNSLRTMVNLRKLSINIGIFINISFILTSEFFGCCSLNCFLIECNDRIIA